MDVEPSDPQSLPAPSQRWPPRARRLIGEILDICDSWLHEPLRLCLGDFDVRLHDRADHTRSHLDQQRYLSTRQRLLQERQAFDQRFLASVHRSFEELGSLRHAPASVHQPLSLLDPVAHELTAALDQLVARSEARGGQVLVELGYRLAVLVAAPPLEGEALPLGPQAMAMAFGDACKALGLPVEHELLLVQSLESSLMQRLGPLYELVNNYLLGEGILPRLRAFSLPRAPSRQTRAPIAAGPARTEAPIAAAEAVPVPAPAGHGSPGDRSEPASAATAWASAEQLQAALLALQLRHAHVNRTPPLSASRLSEAVRQQLNLGHAGTTARVCPSPAQDVLLQQTAGLLEPLSRPVQSSEGQILLGGLQWSLLRLAAFDRQFLDQPEHPARQLLVKLTQLLRDWLDDEVEIDRTLRAKLEQLVERAAHEPPSAGLYSGMLAELEQQLAALNRRALIAERRQVEAMQGREELEQARQRAAELMAARFVRNPPRGLLRAVLEHAWADVLALTLLRHGEESEAFATRMVVTDQLLGRLPAGDRQRLRREVEDGLQEVGMSADEALQIAQALIGGGASTDADAASATDLAVRLKQRQRLGERAQDPGGSAARPAPGSPEQRLLERLHGLPAGRWFEFTDPLSGKLSLRKLAWYSPVSGATLFVTRRGQRAGEMSLRQLAAAIASGAMREAAHEPPHP